MSQTDLVAAFEQACRDAQVSSTRAAAEESLKSFFTHPDAISLAVTVIETTSSSVARFHAAVALHSAARDRWLSLDPSKRYGQNSIRYWLVNYVIANPILLSFERRALLKTAAFLTRRAYLEESRSDKDAFFSSLERALTSQRPQEVIALEAIELIDLLVVEFLALSPSRSASCIEREIFFRAREVFSAANGDVVRLFNLASASLSVLLSHGQGLLTTQDWDARAIPALSVLIKIITNDANKSSLSKNDGSLPAEIDAADMDSENLDAVVNNRFVGPQWVSICGHIPALMGTCFGITGLLLSREGESSESQVLLRATQVIIAIAAISQKSYVHTDKSAPGVLEGLLVGMEQQKWCSCKLGLVRVAFAEVWKRIANAYGLSSVESIPRDWIKTFTKDTCQELDDTAARLSNSDGTDDMFSMDAVDLLLETWANLALQADDGSVTGHRLSSNMEDIVSHFMRTFIRSLGEDTAVHVHAYQLNTEEDLGFEDTSIDDSRVCTTASMARYTLDRLAGQIRHYLMSIAHRVFNWNSGQTTSHDTLSVFQEDLFFLIHFTCAILADEAKGEVPSVPVQFVKSVNGWKQETRPNDGNHIQSLIQAVMEVAQGESYLIKQRGVHSIEASPRVGTAILDGLSKLCRTYLVPVNASSTQTTVQLVGGEQFLESSIIVCFEKAIEGLLVRTYETDVVASAAALVSDLAVGTKNFQTLRKSNYWQILLSQGVEMYQTLPSTAVMHIGQSLTTVLGDEVAERLLSPAYDALRGLAGAEKNSVNAAERTIAIVNLIGGTAKSEQGGSHTRKTLLQLLETPDGIAASCAKAFSRNRPDVSRSFISLADNIVYSSLSLLPGDEARGLVTNAVKLIALHADIVGSQKDSLSVDEVASDIAEALALLTHILEEAVDINVDEACYYGLSKILLIMRNVHLDLPTVGSPFFLFVTRLVCRYPENTFSLPPELCRQVLQVIEMQRRSVDLNAERRGLDAIAALGRAWVSSTNHGSRWEVMGEALRELVGSVFNGVATGGAHTSNLDAAADALLPVMHIKLFGSVSVMEELGQAFLAASGHNGEIRGALAELMTAGNRASSMYWCDNTPSGGEKSRKRLQAEATKSFRAAVTRFSANTRNILLSIALGRTTAS